MLDTFITIIFGWSGLWAFLLAILMISRPDLEKIDLEVIGFRMAVSILFLAIFALRWFRIDPIWLVAPFIIMGYTSFMNFYRVLHIIGSEENTSWPLTLRLSLSRVWAKRHWNRPSNMYRVYKRGKPM